MNRVSQVVDFLQIQRGNPDMKKTSAYAANVAYSFAKKDSKSSYLRLICLQII
ncbi:hypothetical protein IX332_001890 [Porphyromonas levii]|nr:hypothetical protein [Porphyromonas levii]